MWRGALPSFSNIFVISIQICYQFETPTFTAKNLVKIIYSPNINCLVNKIRCSPRAQAINRIISNFIAIYFILLDFFKCGSGFAY
jgi:hypothetical protein